MLPEFVRQCYLFNPEIYFRIRYHSEATGVANKKGQVKTNAKNAFKIL